MTKVKIVCISDTHNQHRLLDLNDRLPLGDVIIHAGDATSMGSKQEIRQFLEWFGALPHGHKILIAGNHDWGFETAPLAYGVLCEELGIHYLNDSGVELEGVHYWGSPVQPEFCQWAFNRQRGKEIREHWNLIPNNTDVLVTHGPPRGIMDLCPNGNVGCEELLEVVTHINPRLHVFGHIHEGRGVEVSGTTTFVNAATLDGRYRPYPEEAIVIELEDKT